MNEYDNLRESYKDSPSEQKLAALRSLMLNPVHSVHGYATLLKRIDLEDPSTFPKDYDILVEKLWQASDNISKILDALTL